MRSLAHSASLAALLAAAACGSHGTELNDVVNQDPFAEAGAGAIGADGGAVADPFAGAPGYKGGQGGDTAHNAGKSCMQSGCHPTSGGGDDAPAFLVGGTVYKDYAGTTAAPGVEIRVVDSAGNTASTVSTSNGTFYIRAGTGGVAFPAIVGARDATTTRPMVTTLTTGMGSCGQNGCHVSGGGGPNASNYYPIHVP